MTAPHSEPTRSQSSTSHCSVTSTPDSVSAGPTSKTDVAMSARTATGISSPALAVKDANAIRSAPTIRHVTPQQVSAFVVQVSQASSVTRASPCGMNSAKLAASHVPVIHSARTQMPFNAITLANVIVARISPDPSAIYVQKIASISPKAVSNAMTATILFRPVSSTYAATLTLST